MFTTAPAPRKRHFAQTYAHVGLETAVTSARPEQLIALLIDGALAAMRKAELHLQAGNIPERCAAISKAINIVESGLKASVDRSAGGEIADNLITVYDLTLHHLLHANRHANLDSLALAQKILGTIGDAWKQATQCV